MKTEANEPAMPTPAGRDGIYPQIGSETWQLPGLTKREYFAALAMQGLLACPEVSLNTESLCNMAVNHADALITELNKPTS